MTKIEDRIVALGLTLPTPPAPVASYVPFVQTGNQLFVSGQLSMKADGTLIKGKAGRDIDLAQAQEAAQACALNLLAQLKAAAGGFDRLARVVKLVGFVNADDDFTDHPKIINAASDLMGELFGDAGRHARAAVGVSSLPLGAAVEIEGIFELKS